MKRGTPVIRTAMLFALLLASLTLTVWRQSRALEILRLTEDARGERVVEEARRSALLRHVDELRSRARVSELAQDRFGMRLPQGGEIVILPLQAPPAGVAAAPGSDPAAREGSG